MTEKLSIGLASHPLVTLTVIFGCFVWLALALVAFVIVWALAVQLWEVACFTGYRIFADKAEKDTIRRSALSAQEEKR